MLQNLFKIVFLLFKNFERVLKLLELLVVNVLFIIRVQMNINFELLPDSFDDLEHAAELSLVLSLVLCEHLDVVGHGFLQ